MLLWLILEYTVGLHDTYIAWHPYVTMFALIIPIVTYRLALREKIEDKYGKLTFSQAFMCGFILTVFGTILAVPLQLAFHKLVNPDFFANMIAYSVKTGHSTPEQAAAYFNLNSYLLETVIGTFGFGILLSLILGFRMRTVK